MKMAQFFTSDNVALEKSVQTECEYLEKPRELLEQTYEIQRCLKWITENNCHKVCLQFPDHLLSDSARIAAILQEKLEETVYILADTSYEPCCIDYVAAAHIQADGVIHFGPVCFSKTTANIPYLYIYEKERLFDVERVKTACRQVENACEPPEKPCILLDTGFIHMLDEFREMTSCDNVKTLECDQLNVENQTVLFVCGKCSERKLPNLKFSHKIKHLYYVSSNDGVLHKYETDARIVKRRYFLVEHIRDSNTVGIVIGTVAVKNYLQVIERIKTLLKLHHKKYYLVSVGKPTVAKLANFPEIDVYVVVTCALNAIYDSRDFYKPIVTPYDVEMALNDNQDLSFSYDYNDFINGPIRKRVLDGDVSLVKGTLRHTEPKINDSPGQEMALKPDGTVAVNTNYGPGYLQSRSWKGLEQDLGQGNVEKATEGRLGVAQQYQDEMSNQ